MNLFTHLKSNRITKHTNSLKMLDLEIFTHHQAFLKAAKNFTKNGWKTKLTLSSKYITTLKKILHISDLLNGIMKKINSRFGNSIMMKSPKKS